MKNGSRHLQHITARNKAKRNRLRNQKKNAYHISVRRRKISWPASAGNLMKRKCQKWPAEENQAKAHHQIPSNGGLSRKQRHHQA